MLVRYFQGHVTFAWQKLFTATMFAPWRSQKPLRRLRGPGKRQLIHFAVLFIARKFSLNDCDSYQAWNFCFNNVHDPWNDGTECRKILWMIMCVRRWLVKLFSFEQLGCKSKFKTKNFSKRWNNWRDFKAQSLLICIFPHKFYFLFTGFIRHEVPI